MLYVANMDLYEGYAWMFNFILNILMLYGLPRENIYMLVVLTKREAYVGFICKEYM